MTIDTSPQSVAKMKDVIDAFLDIVDESDNFVKKTGDTLSGPLHQPIDPSTDTELANKKYVDDVTSGGAAAIKRFEFVATAGQTSITGTDIHGETLEYTPDNLDIFVDGKILYDNDYTATNGTLISFTTPLTVGQEIRVKAYGIFAVANALAKRENLGDLENTSLARVNLGISATNTPLIPAGGMTSTNVQSGVQELNDNKLNKAGGDMQGPLGLYGFGTNGFVYGNGDAINYTTYNLALKLWKGIAFLNASNQVRGYIDTTNGILDMIGNIRVNGQGVWHAGNFTPNSKLDVAGGNLNGNLSITKSDASFTLIDTFNQYRIHTANSGSTPGLRFSFYDVGGTYISTPLYIQPNGDIWSSAFGNSLLTAYTWNQGNFNPNTKANVSGQTFTGGTGVAAADPYLFIERSGIRRWNMNITSDAVLRFMESSNIKVSMDISGNLYATGNVGAYSDIKIKTNIKTIDNALTKVEMLRGVEYNRIDNGDRQIGVIAQEIQKVIPEVIISTKDSNGEELLAVSYGNIVAVLIEATKELSEKVKLLEAELKSLKEK